MNIEIVDAANARAYADIHKDTRLLTTLRYTKRSHGPEPVHTQIPLFERHCKRLRDGRERLRKVDPSWAVSSGDEQGRQAIQIACASAEAGDYRLRVLVDRSGHAECQLIPMPANAGAFCDRLEAGFVACLPARTLALDPVSAPRTTDSLLVEVKTTAREFYSDAMARAAHLQAFDVLIHWCSSQVSAGIDTDLITESCTSNVAIHDPQPGQSAEWITPRLRTTAPFLCGVMRQELFDRGLLREADITVAQLKAAVGQGRLVVGMNGLRGVWRADVIWDPAS